MPLCLQGEDVALFSIDGNHFGYENELDLPNRIDFNGAKGPFGLGLGWAGKLLEQLVNWVNENLVPGVEWLQYRAYFLSFILVRAMLLDVQYRCSVSSGCMLQGGACGCMNTCITGF
jgi:hypothetical protein